MDSRKFLELQSKRGAKVVGIDTVTKTLEFVEKECRKSIKERSEEYRELNAIDKKEAIKQIIIDYVMDTKPLVAGYTDEENRPDTIKIVDKLIENITDYDILTAPMEDPDVCEIRGNGKEIKIEKNGRIRDLTDKDSNIVSFSSVEQQEIIMRKLLGDTRLSPKDAVINSRTIEGYRIAAVHSSATSPDPNDPRADQYHVFVLRKFKKSKMKLGDIVKYRTMSDNMARLLSIATAGGLTFVTCGPTASGKTTTNNAILQSVPPDVRTVLIQNPSEIDLRFKDHTGRVYNDVLHLEAREIENPSPTDPTAANLMDQTLRLSPTLVGFGELRANKEFMLGMKILLAGHPANATYHAETDVGAIKRFLTAYKAESKEDSESALSTLTDLLHLIIIQKIMKDGTRKVLAITEVIGVDENNPLKPKLNPLYKFFPIGDPTYNPDGTVKEIPGVHRRVGKLSDKIIEKLKLEGIKTSRFEFLTKEPLYNIDGTPKNELVTNNKLDEIEHYTGENIERYGMN